jgi:hypothetical protein
MCIAPLLFICDCQTLQAFCLGTAAIYTAPKLEGPWLFSGNLFNQMAIDGKVGALPGWQVAG